MLLGVHDQPVDSGTVGHVRRSGKAPDLVGSLELLGEVPDVVAWPGDHHEGDALTGEGACESLRDVGLSTGDDRDASVELHANILTDPAPTVLPVKALAVALVLLSALTGCGSPSGSGGAGDGRQPAQRVRNADLPTAKEVATIYPGIASREEYGHDPDPFAPKKPTCADDWRNSAPFTAGRWSNYQKSGGEDPYFTGGEGVGVDALSFASAQAAKTAFDSFTSYVDACRGHHSSGDGYDFTRRTLDLPTGFVGYLERFVVDMGTATPTHDESLVLMARRDEFLVMVRIQTDRTHPDQERALQLAKLARRVVGRAPEVPEPVPAGAVLHDYRAKPVFISNTGKASASLPDFSAGFRTFVTSMAAKVEKSVGGEYSIEDCTAGIDVLMYRTDGYAQLSEVSCFGDGASTGYLVAEVNGAWIVIDEPTGASNPGGNCAKLAKVRFPSSIVGSWCQDGSSGGREYPLG